jgi:chromosome segregation ATPase
VLYVQAELRDQCSSLNQRIDDCNTTNTQLQSQSAMYVNDISELRALLQDRNKQCDQLTHDNNELQQSLSAARAHMSSNDITVTSLQSQLIQRDRTLHDHRTHASSVEAAIRRTLVQQCRTQLLPLLTHIWKQVRERLTQMTLQLDRTTIMVQQLSTRMVQQKEHYNKQLQQWHQRVARLQLVLVL